MELKDYYAVLELPPSASAAEVKRAYRRLAQVYHPDKSGNDAYARAQFNAIKEAYETLSSPRRKQEYLQTRWYAQSQGPMQPVAPLTPVSFLQRLIQKERSVYRADAHRSGYSALSQELADFYSDENMELLLSFDDDSTLQEIIACSLRMAAKIPYPYVHFLLNQISRLDRQKKWAEPIRLIALKSRRAAARDKYTPWVAALIAVLICVLIFLAGKPGR